ncbi:hypothetical protein, partial [Vibrio parahaemolyticus]|uniref:hypothetical protein n=1 Tax=Vibrio parahaemolyticus TaxID=670 RepID=UPI000E36C180
EVSRGMHQSNPPELITFPLNASMGLGVGDTPRTILISFGVKSPSKDQRNWLAEGTTFPLFMDFKNENASLKDENGT